MRLVMPAQADMATDTANKNRAILLERPGHAGEYDPITQIIPVAGDPRITLFSCSSTAVSAASSAGYTVVTTGLGLYASPYIIDSTLNTAIGIHQRRVVFSEVTVESDNTGSIQEAADRLLYLALAYMKRHVTTAKEITAVCVSPSFISPRACSTAMRAESAVPVGERSTLPGWMATAAPARKPSAVRSTLPANRQKEKCRQSGFSGWSKPKALLAALVMRTPRRAISCASSGFRLKPIASASTMTKLSPP